MGAWDGYLAHSSGDQRIDKTKVLLIVATDNALSQQVADYYQTARGLAAHRLGFATAQLNAAFTNGILGTVDDYITAHGIECLLTTPGCPRLTTHQDTLEALLANAYQWVHGTRNTGRWHFIRCENGSDYDGPIGYAVQTNPAMQHLAPDGKGYFVVKSAELSALHNRQLIPYQYPHINTDGTTTWMDLPGDYHMPSIAWGRIGFPQYGGMPAETFAETKRMIDDCIWAEQQPKTGKALALGFGDYTAQGIHQLQWYAWQFAQAAGLQTAFYTCDAAGTGGRGLPVAVRTNLTAWLGQPAPDYVSADVYNGIATIAADVYLGSAVINDGIGGTTGYGKYWTSLSPRRGAWGFNWCSSGYQFIGNLIRRGGAAGIGPTQEPYTPGLPEDASVMALALKGYSLAEINWLMQPTTNFAMTAWGDPLYRPFPAPGLGDGITLSVADQTPARSADMALSARTVAVSAPLRTLTDLTPRREATWQS